MNHCAFTKTHTRAKLWTQVQSQEMTLGKAASSLKMKLKELSAQVEQQAESQQQQLQSVAVEQEHKVARLIAELKTASEAVGRYVTNCCWKHITTCL